MCARNQHHANLRTRRTADRPTVSTSADARDSRHLSRVTTDACRGSGSDPTAHVARRTVSRLQRRCVRTVAGAVLAGAMATTALAGGAQVASALDASPCSDAVTALPAAMEDGRSASQVVRVPESIPSDGTVDVSTQLQEWIASLPSGPDATHPTVAEFQPGGCYRVDDTLTLALRSSSGPAGLHWPGLPNFRVDNVQFDLRGAVLFQGDATPWSARTSTTPAQQPRRQYGNPIVFLPGVSGVSILNGTLRSTNASAKWSGKQHQGWACIWVAGALPGDPASANVEVRGMHLTNCWGDGVYVTGMTSQGLEVKRLAIVGNVISGTGRHGVTVQGGSDVLVQGNDIRRIPGFVFDAEPSAAMGINELAWTGNSGSSGGHGYGQYGGAAAAAGSRLTFDGNTIDQGVFRFRFGGGSTPRRGLTIRNNRNVGVDRFERKSYLLGRHIVLVGGNWAEVEVTGNRQPVLESGTATCAVNTGGNPGATVSGNEFPGAALEACAS